MKARSIANLRAVQSLSDDLYHHAIEMCGTLYTAEQKESAFIKLLDLSMALTASATCAMKSEYSKHLPVRVYEAIEERTAVHSAAIGRQNCAER